MSTFSLDGGTTSYTIVPGTLQLNPAPDMRGGGNLPDVKAGIDLSGSCDILIETGGLTLALAEAMQSGVGAGDKTITIDGTVESSEATLDVSIQGDSVQQAHLEWHGTSA